MVRAPQVVRDNSGSTARKSHYSSAAIEKRKFLSASIGDMYASPASRGPSDNMDGKEEEKESFRKLFKAVECLGTSQMSWKERKAIENKRVVSLGGKTKKSDRMPITLGRNIIRKQQKKQQKLLQEGLIDCIQSQKHSTSRDEKGKPDKEVLKVSQGYFRNGTLDVRDILKKDAAASTRKEDQNHGAPRGKRRGKGKQQKSKKKRRRS